MRENDTSRETFVSSLSEEDRQHLDGHELLGRSWKEFEREQIPKLDTETETVLPTMNVQRMSNGSSGEPQSRHRQG